MSRIWRKGKVNLEIKKNSDLTKNFFNSALTIKDKVDMSIKGIQEKAGGSTTPYKDVKSDTKI